MSDLLGWNVTTTNVTSIDHENTREGHFAAVGEAADPMPFTDGQLRQLFEVNQLDYELLCYAQALRSLGLQRGDRIVTLLPNTIEHRIWVQVIAM